MDARLVIGAGPVNMRGMDAELRDSVILPKRLHAPDLPVQVVWIGRRVAHAPLHLDGCPRGMHSLSLVLRGGGQRHAGAWSVTTGPGDLSYLPADQAYVFDATPGIYDYWWLNCMGPAVPAFANAAGFAPGRAAIAVASPTTIAARFRRIQALLRRQGSGFRELAAQELTGLFLDLRRETTPSDPAWEPITALLDHRTVGVAQVAQQLGLSVFQLTRRCQRATGLSPWQYVLRCRMERAAEMLHEPDRSLAEIAAAIGMADAAHLTRCFKRVMGCTPSTYRRRL
jgi:AraC-like DNA-binding protein